MRIAGSTPPVSGSPPKLHFRSIRPCPLRVALGSGTLYDCATQPVGSTVGLIWERDAACGTGPTPIGTWMLSLVVPGRGHRASHGQRQPAGLSRRGPVAPKAGREFYTSGACARSRELDARPGAWHGPFHGTTTSERPPLREARLPHTVSGDQCPGDVGSHRAAKPNSVVRSLAARFAWGLVAANVLASQSATFLD